MKNSLRLLSIIACVVFASSSLQAQVKLGHVNSAELLAAMPESKAADMNLKKFGETLEGQLKTMTSEYQAKIADYQGKEALMAESIKQTKQKEIVDLESRINEFQEQGQQDVQKKKEELYSPILKKAQDAINAVAKENGFTYIFDASTGGLLFVQETNDVTALVKKKLGITAAPATTPEGTKPAENKPVAPKK